MGAVRAMTTKNRRRISPTIPIRLFRKTFQKPAIARRRRIQRIFLGSLGTGGGPTSVSERGVGRLARRLDHVTPP